MKGECPPNRMSCLVASGVEIRQNQPDFLVRHFPIHVPEDRLEPFSADLPGGAGDNVLCSTIYDGRPKLFQRGVSIRLREPGDHKIGIQTEIKRSLGLLA